MCPARRGDGDSRRHISFPASKFVEPVRIHTKDRRIPIDSDLRSPLERMRSMNPRKVLLELIKISVRPKDRPRRLVIRLIKPVRISNARLRVIRRRKEWRAPNEAHSRVRRHMRRKHPRVSHTSTPLMIEELYPEIRI